MSLHELEQAVAKLPASQLRAFKGWFDHYLAQGHAEHDSQGQPGETRIQRTPGVVGGDARVRNTRVAVWTLVALRRQGRSDDQLLGDFPCLTPSDLDAVTDYYREHRAEIDDAIHAEAGGE